MRTPSQVPSGPRPRSVAVAAPPRTFHRQKGSGAAAEERRGEERRGLSSHAAAEPALPQWGAGASCAPQAFFASWPGGEAGRNSSCHSADVEIGRKAPPCSLPPQAAARQARQTAAAATARHLLLLGGGRAV